MKISVALIAGLYLISLPAAVSVAAPEQASSVVDSGGGRASGGTLALVHAIGQPGGIKTCANGAKVLQAGFLNTFNLQPGTDTDGDGLPNETDVDNDNDGLPDRDEITGNAFGGLAATDPNAADSDGDGASDGDEAAAGSDPQDDNMYLHITDIIPAGGDDIIVTWQACGGKTYAVYATDTAGAPRPGTHLSNVTATGGTGPWYATVTNIVDTAAPGKRFYYVKLMP